MNLAKLDLNLVVALQALLEERNVTAAGRKVGLTQPAMSAALGRLRRHFGDELLHRSGGAYELTALGAALLDQTALACSVLERVFSSQADFDPAVAEREFTLLASDYAVAVIGVELARAIDQAAPGVRLTFHRPPATLNDDPGQVLSAVDGLLLPHGIISGLPSVDLYRDSWVVIVSEDNDEVGDQISLKQLGSLPWVSYLRAQDAPAARQLAMLGVEPNAHVSVDSFHLLPSLVAGTRRVAMIQSLLAERLGPHVGIRVLECPFDAVPVQEALWWHPVRTHDAGHKWLRELLADIATRCAPTR